jgi:hypothetical protein
VFVAPTNCSDSSDDCWKGNPLGKPDDTENHLEIVSEYQFAGTPLVAADSDRPLSKQEILSGSGAVSLTIRSIGTWITELSF